MGSFEEVLADARSLGHRKLVQGIGLNDATYQTTIKVFGKDIVCPYYQTWKSMLVRCYNTTCQTRQPTYIGCSVCSEWHTFSVFKAWMETQDWQNNQLDKDILVKGNKIYSPDTCIFVSRRVNLLLTDRGTKRGLYKIGVTFDKVSSKFKAACNNGSKGITIGYFPTEDEAHIAYIKFKKTVIINCASEQTDLRLKQALLTIANSYTI